MLTSVADVGNVDKMRFEGTSLAIFTVNVVFTNKQPPREAIVEGW